MIESKQFDSAFSFMKEVLQNAPVLHQPDFDHPFRVATDTSQYGTGMVLYQLIGGKVRLIEFSMASLKGAQKNYPMSKQELLAILLL